MELRSFTPEEEAYLADVMARKKTPMTEQQWEEFERDSNKIWRDLEAQGVTEEDIIADLEELHQAWKAARIQSRSNGNRPSNGTSN